MVVDAGGVEDGLYVGQILLAAPAGLVVDHADALAAGGGVGDAVEAVDDAADGSGERLLVADGGNGIWHRDFLLKAEDGEGREPAVGLQQLAHIADDDLAVDELEAVERRQGARRVLDVEELALDGLVDNLLDLYLALQHVVDGEAGDVVAREADELAVDGLGGFVEDVTEDAVVDEVVVGVVGLQQVTHIFIEEAQLTAHIGADGGGTDTTLGGCQRYLKEQEKEKIKEAENFDYSKGMRLSYGDE